MNTGPRNHVIAVVGGSGAGKSWLVERLCRALGENAGRLCVDDFYRDRSHLPLAERARMNFDEPDAIDWAELACAIRDGRDGLPMRVPRYDFATHSRPVAPRLQLPRPVLFVEGLWLLHDPELRRRFDLSIFLDAPADLRLARRLARDTVERGYTTEAVRQRLVGDVLPMHDRHVQPQRRWADLVLAQPFADHAVERLADRLHELLAERAVLSTWMRDTFRAELLSLLVDHEYCT